MIRASPTKIEIEWERLSLEESRGHLTGYFISYAPSNVDCSVTGKEMLVFTGQESLVIDDLSSRKEYCISLKASTVKGVGPTSNKLVVPG